MSRVGKVPVSITNGCEVSISGTNIKVKGKLGELGFNFGQDVSVKKDGDNIVIKPLNATTRAKAMWGTVRSNISNMVEGVNEGFKINLEINGVGYRSQVKGNMIILFLGYSHQIIYPMPVGIKIVCPKPTEIEISGFDKQLVGQVASDIIKLRPPEPYKGKGIKKVGQYVRRKEGKKK